ncbi:MAG: shikimate kinase [Gammaproteobacteria bacterium]|nr:shikimate kinase [Gammaproteobacteria bacterium]MDH5729176.1 shikimate kinase [Gammaproteobacteria bacterium]
MALSKQQLSQRIFLIGPMGVGKTTIGVQLAQNLKLPFYDSDKELEKHTGASIPLIFELEGEDGFRKRETAILLDLVKLDQFVIATGGGIIIRPENREILKNQGFNVFLTADIEKLFERTSKDRNRPLLQTDDPHAKLKQIMSQRLAFYQEVADLCIDTGVLPIRRVVSKIKKALDALK